MPSRVRDESNATRVMLRAIFQGVGVDYHTFEAVLIVVVLLYYYCCCIILQRAVDV